MNQEPGSLRALPPEEPLSMPRAPLHGPRQPPKERRDPGRRLRLGLARGFVVAAALGLGGYGCHQMYQVVSSVAPTALQWVFVALFGINFLWISVAFAQAVLGFFLLMRTSVGSRNRHRPPLEDRLPTRTAVLIPVYNEDPVRVAAAVRAMGASLAETAPAKFAFFVLSDSTDPHAWIREEEVFQRLYRESAPGCPCYYRHRAGNTERKSGNLADWVQRWGGGYEAMVVLDADSLMAPETLTALVRRLAADPGVGLIQTLPQLVRGRSLFARLQQFAGACYGPLYAAGLAGWYGSSGNYWGHNAAIRVRAFAAACHLPVLTGAPPFGGHILSHDFAEAALMRRAGWGVEFHTDLSCSYEESPPSLMDGLIRDRRWCQGNVQHIRLLTARGLRLPSRLHLMFGVMSYFSAVVWLALIATGLALAVQVGVLEPEYFPAPSLFPHWPVFEAERALALLAVSAGVLLGPKMLGWLHVLLVPRIRREFGGLLPVTRGVIAETLLSALYAPVMMLSHSGMVLAILVGRDSGWGPQRREGSMAGWRIHWTTFVPHALTGAGIAAGAAHLSPQLFFWLLPFSGALMLAPWLSRASGSTRAGDAAKRWKLLLSPQEQSPPAIVRRFEDCLAEDAPGGGTVLRRLADDPDLRRWHMAQLGPAYQGEDAVDVDHVVALAKAARSREDLDRLSHWLSPRETMALLNDRGWLEELDRSDDPARFAGGDR